MAVRPAIVLISQELIATSGRKIDDQGGIVMIYTCDTNYRFHVAPVEVVDKDGWSVTTWKYDSDQEYFNFEVQVPLDQVKDDFHWDEGAPFYPNQYRDLIERIGSVIMKDGLLIISGLKTKGNEPKQNE